MRQDNVKEDARNNDPRSPIKRTFAEAKQTMNDYDEAALVPFAGYNEDTFLEADEDDSYMNPPPTYRYENYSASESKVVEQGFPIVPAIQSAERSAESFLHESMAEYNQPVRKERPRRRRSRELAEEDIVGTSNDDEPKRKPETMRSISEDTPTRSIKQTVTRRTLSHPEKDTPTQVNPLRAHSNNIPEHAKNKSH